MGLIRFDAQGWRARVGAGFDEQSVMRIAHALGCLWAEQAPGATIYVAFDTRRDSQELAVRAGQAMAACGLMVAVGHEACPLPALGWAVAHDPQCVGGVMLTAREASYEYGGVVALQHDGAPVSAAFASLVEQRIAGKAPSASGPVERVDLIQDYSEGLAAAMAPHLAELRAPRVVVDPLYGSCVGVATSVFKRLGCDVVPLHDRAVPDFRGLHPHAREPWVDQCERTVVEQHAALGIVLDGDGSHAGLIDETGHLVSRHSLAPLAMRRGTSEGQAGRVVATQTASVRVERQAARLGCAFTRVPLGFEAQYREFGEGDVVLAADAAGAVCVPAHLPQPDALLAAALAGSAIVATGEHASVAVSSLEAAWGPAYWGSARIPLSPAGLQLLRNVLPGINPAVIAGEQPLSVSHAGGVRLQFAHGAWLAVAAPGPAALVAAEAASPARLSELLAAGRELALGTIV